jgi:channel protein (hemolysin III family)
MFREMTATAPYAIPGFADPISSLSHLIACVVFAVLAVPLIRRGMRARDIGDPERHRGRVLSLVVFSFSAVLLLSMSGVFHLLPYGSTGRAVLQRLDHAAIFILIAGTFTPTHAIMFRGPGRWGILSLIWLIAIVGVTFKSIYFTQMPHTLGLAMYLGMGWIGLVSMVGLWRSRGFASIIPLLLGGLAYTVGALIDGAELPPLITGIVRSHEIFHIAVIVGLACHWRFIWGVAELYPLEPPTQS